MAYGWTVTEKKGTYILSIVSVPSMEMDFITDDKGVPHAVTTMNGHLCYVRRIYVEAKEKWHGVPTVLYVTVTGISTKDGSIQKMRKDVNKK